MSVWYYTIQYRYLFITYHSTIALYMHIRLEKNPQARFYIISARKLLLLPLKSLEFF